MQEKSDCIIGEQETVKQTVVFLELVPDIWERLPHFQDNIEKILFSPEDLLLDPKTMKYNFQLTDEDRLSSDQDESDQIWVDHDSSEMNEPPLSPSQPRLIISESFEDLGEIQDDATAFSVATISKSQSDGRTEDVIKESADVSPGVTPESPPVQESKQEVEEPSKLEISTLCM